MDIRKGLVNSQRQTSKSTREQSQLYRLTRLQLNKNAMPIVNAAQNCGLMDVIANNKSRFMQLLNNDGRILFRGYHDIDESYIAEILQLLTGKEIVE